jgi:hypothetical protein
MRSMKNIVFLLVTLLIMSSFQCCNHIDNKSGNDGYEITSSNFNDENNDDYLLFVKAIYCFTHEGDYGKVNYLIDLYNTDSIEDYDVFLESFFNNNSLSEKVQKILYDIKSNKIVLNKYTDMDLRCWHQSGELLLTDINDVYLAESFDKVSKIHDKYLDNPALSPDKRFLAYNLPGIFIHEKEGYNGTEDFGYYYGQKHFLLRPG